jgi:hypothetical protein
MAYSPDKKICLICANEFKPRERMTHQRWADAKYCSLACNNSRYLGRKLTEETKQKIAKGNMGRVVSTETRNKIAISNTGKKRTPEQLATLSKAHVGISMPFKGKKMPYRSGKNHWNWRGGNSKGYKTGYYSFEYKEWRKAVFERDEYTCKECGVSGVYVTAHHIKSFAQYPELRFDLKNGVTLCEECHSKTDNYKGRVNKKTNQLAGVC